jgi:fibronectin type 3 domain-containing protein
MLIARPGNVSASDGAYDTKVRVTWAGVDCDYYGVYRADTEDGVKQLLSATTTTSYEDTDIEQLKPYWYSVKACHTEGDCSAFSDQDKGWSTFSWINFDWHVYLPVVVRSLQE